MADRPVRWWHWHGWTKWGVVNIGVGTNTRILHEGVEFFQERHCQRCSRVQRKGVG